MFGFSTKKRIYLDHASATPIASEVADAVRAAMDFYGNPGATHAEATAAKKVLQESRERIAAHLQCKARELIFTSGLTESNNLAILGLARKIQMDGKHLAQTHWVVSSIEHDSVLESFAEIERLGGRVTHVDPDDKGIISPEAVARTIKPETVLVSIAWANNEIGVVQPLKKIAAEITHKNSKTLLHTDAGQASLYLHPHVHTLGVDMMSLSSGKLYGPRGAGVLYMSNRVDLAPTMLGGGQERGLRAGTEDPALAAGFAEAFDLISRERESESRRLQKLRGEFAKKISARFPGALINGDIERALPHMLNISLPKINAEYVVLALDQKGIAISTKSACNEGEANSHVVTALGGPEWRAKNTLRFSLGRKTTEDDVEKTLQYLEKMVTQEH